MAMKIWELHALQIGPSAIVTTPEGDAYIEGELVLSEKAYLLAVRDFRPAQLVELVAREGGAAVAARLVRHFDTEESRNLAGGRSLVVGRGQTPGPMVRRTDEVEVAVPSGSDGER